jgi:hypothetical protein
MTGLIRNWTHEVRAAKAVEGLRCSHCLRRTGRWHVVLGQLNVCSPPSVPWDLKAIQAAHKANECVVDAAGVYRDEQTETNWLALRAAVDHYRTVQAKQ